MLTGDHGRRALVACIDANSIPDEKVFMVFLDDGKQTYNISCGRTCPMPTLDDIESKGRPCSGRQVAHELKTADESKALWFGNNHDGFWMRHGERHAYIIPFTGGWSNAFAPGETPMSMIEMRLRLDLIAGLRRRGENLDALNALVVLHGERNIPVNSLFDLIPEPVE